MHGAHILPKPARFGCTAAICCRKPAFFPSEAPSGTHEAKKLPRLTAREHATAKCCHGSPPRNASERYLAIAGSPGTHRGGILPLSDAGERISRAFCHRRAPGNTPRRYLARAGSPGTHRGDTLPRQTPFKNASRRHLAEKALGCPGLLRNRSGTTESEDADRTKRRAIQQRMPTRPRNREKILVPFAKKRHQKRTRVVWRT